MTPLPLLGGISAEQFLKEYWQKKPLLIRNALPRFQSVISPEELAGLACEDHVSSRLVSDKDNKWSLRNGPFTAKDFQKLPKQHWTLLVQDCDAHVPAVEALLKHFSFLPAWRIDDIMISFAAPGGSVGPHVDQYDVFLLQAQGQRHWQISQTIPAADNFLPDSALRILKEFHPDEEWVVNPGDLLYLPPGIPHYGVAVDACMTYSVGFRAPAHADLLTDFVDQLAPRLEDSIRYNDTDLALHANPGEITQEDLARFRQIFLSYLSDEASFSEWLGRFVTRPKYAESPYANPVIQKSEFQKQLLQGAGLLRLPYARLAFSLQPQNIHLFANDEVQLLPTSMGDIIKLLCNQRNYPQRSLKPFLSDNTSLDLLYRLYAANLIGFIED